MFRLMKIIDKSNFTMEPVLLAKGALSDHPKGMPVTALNGTATLPSATDVPTHMTLEDTADAGSRIRCYTVNDNMIFKVEYVGAATPRYGLKVGFTTVDRTYDAVTVNANGNAIVTEVCDDPGYVYIKFQK